MCVPPQTMEELARRVYQDIHQNSAHGKLLTREFLDLDILLDLLDKYGISVTDIHNPAQYEIHFEYIEEGSAGVNKFMIWCKGSTGKLTHIKDLLHPRANEIESDWLIRRTYHSQPNTKINSTRNRNIRLEFDRDNSGSTNTNMESVNLDSTSKDDGSKLQGWRAEKFAFQYLRTEMVSLINEECERSWEGNQYVFKNKTHEVGKLIWHDCDLFDGSEPVNNPGFDIEKVHNKNSTYYEVKSGASPTLSPTQQQFAINVGQDNYIVLYVDLDSEPPNIQELPYWNRLKRFWNEEHNDIAIKEQEVAQPVTREPEGQTVVVHKLETNQKNPSEWFWGTGRRKRAVARVRIKPGSGVLEINGRTLANYFTELKYHQDIQEVCKKTSTMKSIDIYVNVQGGGQTGQAGAIVLGLGRALKRFDPTLEPILRENGYLTRDPRQVERKKPGQPGARKRFQFSKR